MTTSKGTSEKRLDSEPELASLQPEQITFRREDWVDFRSIDTLPRRAGVTLEHLPAVLIKELVDNALDSAGDCRFGLTPDNGFWVEDEGDGIPGTPDQIAELFSISRPLTSTKTLRLPSRGALGNGLRVVAGSVLASGGRLNVATRGLSIDLDPQYDGSTRVTAVTPYAGKGTRIEVGFGPEIDCRSEAHLILARRAKVLAAGRSRYRGRSSPYWYDSAAFFELFQAAGSCSVRDLVRKLAGCTGRSAGQIAEPYKRRTAGSLTRDETDGILRVARAQSTPVHPNRLGRLGRIKELPRGYAHKEGLHRIGKGTGQFDALIPFVVEVWVDFQKESKILLHVNRTPVVATIGCALEKAELVTWGCGLDLRLKVGRQHPVVHLNVDTPYIRITNEGKQPDLSSLRDLIGAAIKRAYARARRQSGGGISFDGGLSRRALVFDALPGAIQKSSGGGRNRFNLRHLYYVIRPLVQQQADQELNYKYFERLITDYENERGDIPGMYRDVRGMLYHPHTGERIPVGTLAVEKYRRPAFTFNKVLYCEKEGLVEILIHAKWPERNDCAVLSSKGFATRAVRDVLDHLDETDEEITFFCIHDADGPGTQIFESLQEETLARPARTARILNLGLNADEAIAIGLEEEKIKRAGKGAVPVAKYVEGKWRGWYQDHRIELNAMTPQQFIEWLDKKVSAHGVGKVVPPDQVLSDRLAQRTRDGIRSAITEEALKEARVDERVETAMQEVQSELDERRATLRADVTEDLATEDEAPWTTPIGRVADDLVAEWISRGREGASG